MKPVLVDATRYLMVWLACVALFVLLDQLVQETALTVGFAAWARHH